MIITACYDNQSEIELPKTFRNLNPLIVDSIAISIEIVGKKIFAFALKLKNRECFNQ